MTIYLRDSALTFDFSDYHPWAKFSVAFQRTLRIPDDGRDYPLPPGLGTFPLEHVDDHEGRLPSGWHERGGVFLPMYQGEAMWMSFRVDGSAGAWFAEDGRYPFAVKIATGKINCVTGEPWSLGLKRSPVEVRREGGLEITQSKQDQNYVALPQQPWLDGYAIEKGVVRQFVAMPLGQGYTAEEQLTGAAEWGGIQIVAYPLKKSKFEELETERQKRDRSQIARSRNSEVCYSMSVPSPEPAMGLAPGGRMRQHIYEDKFELDDWDLASGQRCFVAILNSHDWLAATGASPPTKPVSAQDYSRHGLPWFDFYADAPTLEGAERLAGLKGIAAVAHERDRRMIPEFSESVRVTRVVKLGSPANQRVRQGEF